MISHREPIHQIYQMVIVGPNAIINLPWGCFFWASWRMDFAHRPSLIRGGKQGRQPKFPTIMIRVLSFYGIL